MKCKRECEKPNRCENLQEHEIIVEDYTGLFPHKRCILGFKCKKFGQIALTTLELPKSKQFNDIIYRKF